MKNTFKITYTAIIIALCEVFLLATGLFPFATYALPAIAGMLLCSVMVEFGGKTAYLAYFAASILGLFIAPDKEAAIMFFIFFGHYPISKAYFERIGRRWLEIILKLLSFNTIMISAYAILIYIVGMKELLEGFSDFGKFTLPILLILANIVFIVYDIGLTRVIKFYVFIIKPRIVERFKK